VEDGRRVRRQVSAGGVIVRPCGGDEIELCVIRPAGRSVWALPAFVGCHWFQYVDQALTGRFDGENYNIGFVTVTDTPYPEMVEAAREVNVTVYRELGQGEN
jgi:hypothetical protein